MRFWGLGNFSIFVPGSCGHVMEAWSFRASGLEFAPRLPYPASVNRGAPPHPLPKENQTHTRSPDPPKWGIQVPAKGFQMISYAASCCLFLRLNLQAVSPRRLCRTSKPKLPVSQGAMSQRLHVAIHSYVCLPIYLLIYLSIGLTI